jgi:dolichol-phosphate mannosyltransferase
LTALFSFKLSNLITKGAGLYAVMLLSIMPYFFIQSLVITPDAPLIACWSALLYYLYRALVLNEGASWYWSGICLGLGLLSKYTIVLLGLPTFAYLCINPASRVWFKRKEPYLCVFIGLVLFTPVIYWNATHEWVSFIFQSTRRFNEHFNTSFHAVIGLLVIFLMPVGVASLWALFRRKPFNELVLDGRGKLFFQLFTGLPLVFFAIFSLTHQVKFNWIGPCLLAVIPWIAVLIRSSSIFLDQSKFLSSLKCLSFYCRHWFLGALIILFIYMGLVIIISVGLPERAYKPFFTKFIAWSTLTQDFHKVALNVEDELHVTPIFVPLDFYNINSELSYYQSKFLSQNKTAKVYPVNGAHIFGIESLMYKYWVNQFDLTGRVLILIATDLNDFNNPQIESKTIKLSEVKTIWARNQGQLMPVRPYYYKIVHLKHV